MTSDDLLLVTGASSEIGVALLRHMLQTSAVRVLAHSFRSGGAVEALREEFGDRIVPLQADFADAGSVSAMADTIAVQGIPSSFVHLPAMKLKYERFTKFEWERFEKDMNVQLRSSIILLQRFLPRMAKLPRARVVFVLSSVVHGMPPKYMSMYTVAKYAQLGLMRALASEYAATPVTVNAISPSMVETQFLSEIGEVAVQMSAAASPLGRNARPTDLIGALSLLLSKDSDYITGVDIPIAAGIVI